ncbi:MAG TPA: nucleoside deaminase [Pseudomonadota bacterium]|jgi:tRNA(Arg) A34 adenosine deaminase TadA|nr:nucleoside deaminase [Pseudomonadota bacterium]
MIHAQVHLTLPAWASTDIDPLVRFDNDEARMRFVAGLARKNVELGTGGPFGAAIFDGDGRLVSIGVNRVVPQNCSLAHAEIMAFLTAQQRLQRFRLNENGQRYVLVTSAQPCCQCYGASFWAGIDEMQIGARAEDVMSLTEFDEGPLPADWVGELEKRGVRVTRDLLRDECRDVLAFYSASGGASY